MATDRGRPRERTERDGNVVPLRGRSAMSDARRYTPRAKTLREAGDEARPQLRVVPVPEEGTAEAPAPPGTPPPRPRPARRGQGEQPEPAARRAPAAGQGKKAAGTQKKKATARKPGRKPVRLGPVAKWLLGRDGKKARLTDPRRRLRLSAALLLLLFAAVGGRLIHLQVTKAAEYSANGLVGRLAKRTIPAPRGPILDRKGAVLAHSVEARLVFADPPLVENVSEVAEKLSPLLAMSKTDLWQKLQVTKLDNGQPNRYVVLQRGADISTGDAIEALNLAGVGVRRDFKREMPGNDLAANVVGRAGTDGRGLNGLESSLDSYLYGRDGTEEFEAYRGELKIPSGFYRETPARPGSTVQLTIDNDLQFQAQQMLTEKMLKHNAKFACAVVMDVKTGELLALASTPGYDLANPQDEPKPDSCTQVAVEPGSVHKAITIGGALQEGVVKPDDLIFTEPTIRKGDTTYEDTHWHDPKNMTLPGIFAHSSNVGTIHIADKLGPQKLYEYQQRFGLGKKTGLGLPGESPGLVQPPENWSGSSSGSIPIGHGVSVTPIQMTAAYAAIANDGVYVQPHLVASTTASGGKPKPVVLNPSHRVLDPQHAKELRTMMEAVTSQNVDGATGKGAAIAGYRVSGKTGTGKLVGPDGKYAPGEVASFVGMAPAEAPRYVVAVFAYSPGGEGGTIAAPVFKDVMRSTLLRYAVPPSEGKAPDFKVYG
ncbi:peptidoglycan D,D-transpeptidase FtsI family protein [Longispora albida]|uniref:peptidoglycan D,D-transpeptidase FtsI family protein n=1 Tax=Longispora albida TaxID=203523 RepID=UPI0003A2ED66|nr:penicillin-binding protein 2 [Longispora albida]